MLFLPEIRLQRLCSALFAYLVNNHNQFVSAGKEEESYLYLLFHKDTKGEEGEENYYKQAVALFNNSQSERAILVRPIFDRARTTLPTVHVVTPQDVPSIQFLGDIEGGFYSNGEQKFERGFSAQFSYLVTSDNIMEVNIITYVLRALLLSSSETLDSIGFINPRIVMQEISLGPDVVPSGVYVKGVIMEASYTEVVPPIRIEDQCSIVNNVFFIYENIK